MRYVLCLIALGSLAWRSVAAEGPTEADLTKQIERLIALDSIDLAPKVKFRAGLEPSLHALDADESAMTSLKDPYAAFGQDHEDENRVDQLHFAACHAIADAAAKG